VYEIEPDPKIGFTEENLWFERDFGRGPDGAQDYWLDKIENHRKIVNHKVMLLCLLESGKAMYLPLKNCYKLARAASNDGRCLPSIVDDYLIEHKLLNPAAPIKNRWRKLGYRKDPNTIANTTVSPYDEWTTDKKLLKLIKSHVPEPITWYQNTST
jgi:hypothetical protein